MAILSSVSEGWNKIQGKDGSSVTREQPFQPGMCRKKVFDGTILQLLFEQVA